MFVLQCKIAVGWKLRLRHTISNVTEDTDMLDQSTARGRIIAAALGLAATRDWHAVTLRDIAEAAGVALVDLKGEFASKSGIMAAFTRAVDDAVLRAIPPATSGQSRRDALFDVIMSRFDALAPYKTALRSIMAGAAPDPALIRPLLASQHWMLAAAGIGTDGIGGRLRVAGLASLYAGMFRTWLADDDPGLARTMAALDRRLRRAESTITSIEDVAAGAGRIVRDVPGVLRETFARRRPKAGGDGATAAEPGTGSGTV